MGVLLPQHPLGQCLLDEVQIIPFRIYLEETAFGLRMRCFSSLSPSPQNTCFPMSLVKNTSTDSDHLLI